ARIAGVQRRRSGEPPGQPQQPSCSPMCRAEYNVLCDILRRASTSCEAPAATLASSVDGCAAGEECGWPEVACHAWHAAHELSRGRGAAVGVRSSPRRPLLFCLCPDHGLGRVGARRSRGESASVSPIPQDDQGRRRRACRQRRRRHQGDGSRVAARRSKRTGLCDRERAARPKQPRVLGGWASLRAPRRKKERLGLRCDNHVGRLRLPPAPPRPAPATHVMFLSTLSSCNA
ncbi:hypothetical protein T484DRAFT_1933187, partial [Baffinella frigidus]